MASSTNSSQLGMGPSVKTNDTKPKDYLHVVDSEQLSALGRSLEKARGGGVGSDPGSLSSMTSEEKK